MRNRKDHIEGPKELWGSRQLETPLWTVVSTLLSSGGLSNTQRNLVGCQTSSLVVIRLGEEQAWTLGLDECNLRVLTPIPLGLPLALSPDCGVTPPGKPLQETPRGVS